MKNKMNLRARLLYSQNWNIGFVNQDSVDFLKKQTLGKIRWMKHPFGDRWFADPFIYKVTEEEIIVFVEECLIKNPKGILVELHVDKKTMCLRKRYVLLSLDTHLSYPAIIEHHGKTYVYPENGASGKLSLYEYDEKEHRLINPVCIINEALKDSTILYNDYYYLIATNSSNSQEGAFLYRSETLTGFYQKVCNFPVQDKRSCSRPAGNWLELNGVIYRPAQNCQLRYGSAMNIMRVDSLSPFKEQVAFSIEPKSFKYNLGTHTINFCNDGSLAAVDGYGYLNPLFARIWYWLVSIKRKMLN